MPSLRVNVDGLDFPNPFVIGSGPPSTNAKIMCKAFAAGWGGVVAKTVALTDTEVINVQPRYGKLKKDKLTVGFENIELISRSGVSVWLDPSFEVLLERLERSPRRRPLFQRTDQLRELWEARLPSYRRASMRIPVTGDDDARTVTGKIVEGLKVSPCVT